ncbi:MAG: DUF2157 domain-containing protein [Bryobacterales bacterium]|nr:DUF2157 domain-containing protein [Bryobacterales bacterium]
MASDRPVSKQDAQRRADRIRIVREELERLREEGVLELRPEQQEQLDLHLDATLYALSEQFDIDTSESQKRISWGMRIASTIAGLALCAALVLFFNRIWGALPMSVQVGVLAAAPLAALAGMEFSARRERTFYYTALLGIVAFACAVTNLSVLGAMFNLPGSPWAFLVWAVFGLGLAYAYRLQLLLAAGLVCLIVFVATTLTRLSGLYWAAADSRVETLLASGVLVLLAPSALERRTPDEFSWVYRMLGLLAVFVAILALSLNGALTYLPFGQRGVEIGYQIAGLGAAAVTMWRGVVRRMPGAVNLGAAFFALYLYIRLFEWWWDWMPKYLFFFIIGLISLSLLYSFQRFRKRIR